MNILIASPFPDRSHEAIRSILYQQCTGIEDAVRMLLAQCAACHLCTLSYASHGYYQKNKRLCNSDAAALLNSMDLIIQIGEDSLRRRLDVSETKATIVLYPAFPYSLVQNEIGIKCHNILTSPSINALTAKFINATLWEHLPTLHLPTLAHTSTHASRLATGVDPSVHYTQFSPVDYSPAYAATEHVLIVAFAAAYAVSTNERSDIFKPLSDLALYSEPNNEKRTQITLVTDLQRDANLEDELLSLICSSFPTRKLRNDLVDVSVIDARTMNISTLISLMAKSDQAIFLGNGLYADASRYAAKTYTGTNDRLNLTEIVSTDVPRTLLNGYQSGSILPNRLECLAYVLGVLTDMGEFHLPNQHNRERWATSSDYTCNVIINTTVTHSTDLVSSALLKLDTYRKKLRKFRESPSRFIADSKISFVRRLIPLVKH